MTEFPTEEFNEINRCLFLLFDWCNSAEAIIAQQAATKSVAELKEILEKEHQTKFGKD